MNEFVQVMIDEKRGLVIKGNAIEIHHESLYVFDNDRLVCVFNKEMYRYAYVQSDLIMEL